MSNEIKNLKKAILNSGIHLEIQVSQLLQKSGWKTVNQFPYFDEIDKKIRALDVVAMKKIGLAIECKKATDHPWTFFVVPKSDPWPKIILEKGAIRTTMGKEVPPSQFPKSHILDEKINVGTIEYTPFSKKDDFFEAKHQVLSGLHYANPSKETKELGFPVYPVIVFEGKMWEFYLDKGELQLKPLEYLHFIASSPLSQGDFLIDVVNITYLPKFLEAVDQETK